MFRFVVRRPILFGIIFFCFLLGGGIALSGLKISLLPEVRLPHVEVIVPAPGLGPEEVEQRIVRKLEFGFRDLEGLEHLRSEARANAALVRVEFRYGSRDIDIAAVEVQRRLSEIRSDLPESIEEPIVRKIDPELAPIQVWTLSGAGHDPGALRELAENRIKPLLEQVEGVARVTPLGGSLRAIRVHMRLDRMAALNISPAQVAGALRAKNVNIPAGAFKSPDGTRVELRTLAQFDDVEDIRDTLLDFRGQRAVRLRDVAEVIDGYAEATSFASIDGLPAISLDIVKESDANATEVSARVRQAVAQLATSLPEGIALQLVKDDADFISGSIGNLVDSAWLGFLLAFLAVFLFLGRLRPALALIFDVPISFIGTFLVIWLAGLDISIVVLYALTMTIGVNFDDSVLIVENITRRIENGLDPLKAAAEGTAELVAPDIASTLTNIVVFVPLLFLAGYIGDLMKVMALTAICALTASLPVSLFLTSNVTPRIVGRNRRDLTDLRGIGWLLKLPSRGVLWLRGVFLRVLGAALRHRALTVVASVLVFAASLALVPLLGGEFMPRTDQEEYRLELECAASNHLGGARMIFERAASLVAAHPEVDAVVLRIGGEGPLAPPENTAELVIRFSPKDSRRQTAIDTGFPEEDVVSALRSQIQAEVPGLTRLAFVQPAPWWGSAGAPIEVRLQGYDHELLEQLADQTIERLRGLPGVHDISKDSRPSPPEIRLLPRPEELTRVGMAAGGLASYVRQGVSATVLPLERTDLRIPSFFQDRAVYITVDLAEPARDAPEDLESWIVPSHARITPSIRTLADIELGTAPPVLRRLDGRSIVTIGLQVSSEPMSTLVFERILPVLDSLSVPADVERSLAGEVTRMNDQFSGMAIGFLLAFVFVYLILAAQFESLAQPLVMMAAVPPMLSGVFVALFLTGNTLNTTSGNGIFALLGVVVNTSVVLIDYTNTLRKRHPDKTLSQVIIDAVSHRFRPLLITATSTFVALLPMALAQGEGSDMYRPLAVAFLGGIVSSTAVTLLLIPVLYSVLESWRKQPSSA